MEEVCLQARDEWPEATVSEMLGYLKTCKLTRAVNRDDFISKFKLTNMTREEVLKATVTG